ncbi:TolC family protein [Novosphingobium humi]|uniref:TolC family protein n=1 Tax=Novosphingobium humi TaxID=2282397 RepID=UPI0025B0A377|nr:TolC family protein [Novosphingobium humi]WJT01178.1 TolC family protein [Novosphingobium humi]
MAGWLIGAGVAAAAPASPPPPVPAVTGAAPVYGPPAPMGEPDAAAGEMAPAPGLAAARVPVPDQTPPALAFNAELTGLIEEAVRRHPSVASQRASLRAAGVDVTAARLTRLPTMSIQFNQYGAILLSRQVTANVDLPLWTNGRIPATIDRAKANREAQFYRLAETVLDLELEVNQSYHDAKRLGEHEQVLVGILAVMDDMVASMRRRVAQEVSPEADLKLANSRRLQVAQQLDLVRAQRASALGRLSGLVVRDDIALAPGFAEPTAWPHWDLPALTERMIAASPQRRRVMAEAQVARDDARITAASRLPGLFASYTYDEIYKHRVGLSVRMQTTGGFSEIFATHAARLRETASELQAPSVAQDLKATASNDLIEYDSARARDAGARALAGDSHKITESYVRQFVSGRRTWLDVMNAVREAMTADLDAIDVRYSASAAAMRILLRSNYADTIEEGRHK